MRRKNGLYIKLWMENQKDVLNFAQLPLIVDTVTVVEAVIKFLVRIRQMYLRGQVSNEQKNIAILPADKGRASFFMNKEEHHSKLTQLIQSGTNSLVNKDPTKTQETKNRSIE